eukprot:TRINITY_DN12129_c0_g1_i3.p1 TRINITY_DN12129_c0_g1~~TRINITY_DN12129_c0_g1_i3.p1  ORF type:complete len:376 (+),score=69.02 TRINITY_DN12129_c0_g1_i3:91-1218(+)
MCITATPLRLAAFALCLAGLLAQRPPLNPYWGRLQRVYIKGGPFANENCDQPDCSIMEPFLSRDGRFLFFNSENVGNDTALHYATYVSPTVFQYVGRLTGQANGPIPHLDAVPAMDRNSTLYWISTRDYPDNIHNVMTGRFDAQSGGVPVAQHLDGDIYIQPQPPQAEWIVMDQEANEDGSLIFYSNARFALPTAYDARPNFSNISVAALTHNSSGFPVRATKLPNGSAIMQTVNEYRTPKLPANVTLRYSPASHGNDSLELMFAASVDDTFPDPYDVPVPIVSGIFVANRTSRTEPFGPLTQLNIPIRGLFDPQTYFWYTEPEAPTFTPDGKRIYFTRIDCILRNNNQKGIQEGSRTLPTPYCSYHLWTMERAG